MKKYGTLYRPTIYSDDGTNIDWYDVPELPSTSYFADKEDAKDYMDELGYLNYRIDEFEFEDLEDEEIDIVDCHGEVYDIVSIETSEKVEMSLI